MTRRERVLAALRHQQPDKTPHHIDLTIPAHKMLEEHFGVSDLEDTLDNHLAFATLETPDCWREVRPGFFQDEFGVVWDRTVDRDIGNVIDPQLQKPSLDGYRFPDPRDPRRFEAIQKLIARNEDRLVFCNIGFSLFERAWTLRGMEHLLTDMVDYPEFVEELLDAIVEFNLALIEQGLKYEIDGFRFGDDWGQQHGLIMGPRFWRRFIKPRLARMYGLVKDAGKFVMIHSCGDVKEIFDDLIEIGVDIFNPFQPEVMDPREMKRRFGDRISFYGGLSLQRTLPYGKPDDVRAEVRMLISEVGRGGGYILSPSHAVPRDVPLENLLAMVETLQEQ